MGKKGFNWKARQVVHTVIDDSSTKKIELDLKVGGKYDASNQLVLPSEKRKTKIKRDGPKVTRILSKKHRKKLEKIVDRKKKKENRSSLLEALANVQAKPEELKQLTSIASVQTKGLKRFISEQKSIPKRDVAILNGEIKLNSIAGAKRKAPTAKKIKSDDPNVVGFDSSDSDGGGEEGDSEDEEISDDTTSSKKPKIEVSAGGDNKEDGNDLSELPKTEVGESAVVVIDETDDGKPKTSSNNDKKQLVTNSTSEADRKPAVFVQVDRDEKIQNMRLKLPILAMEQEIMEIINESSVVLLAGETGSGKTTQLPQFLYEAGYALQKQIAITEPRRVAAIAMSKRVAEEMSLSAEEVSYLIRFEGNVGDKTKIKFMTDGVLLKEVQTDFLLSKYSVVVLDEAHERSVYTDILIGLLSRIVILRQKRGDPLKLVVMSATLRLKDFTENRRLFKISPPVVKVEARQFPVTVHFNKVTKDDYLKEAFSKAVKVHTKLPEGGILIFVTGQQEVNHLVRKLRRAFPLKHKKQMLKAQESLEAAGEDEITEDGLERSLRRKNKKRSNIRVIPKINLDDYGLPGDSEIVSDDEIEASDESDDEEDPVLAQPGQPLWVLPLYSLLPTHKQAEVFRPPPVGCRFCVVSTNVAETSLTIPNVKYVVDTGKTKVKLYDKITGVSSHVVAWTSKASADQRAGRAGRLGPGHCYRLYSSAVFNDVFQDFTEPEIRQKPVDDLFLQMKCMNIDKVINFPFPTTPDLLQLRTAERNLEILGAIRNGKVTPLGRAIAKFPVLPRFGKMLALSHQQDLLAYTICLVAALSVQEVLQETPVVPIGPEEAKALRQRWFAIRQQWASFGNARLLGDNMVLLHAVGAAEYANSEGRLERFCRDNGLRHKAVVEIRKLRLQLTNEIKVNVPDADIIVDPKLQPPTDLQAKLLRQILLAGMGDHVAKKIMPDEIPDDQNRAKYKYAYHAANLEDPVFLHNGSVLRKTLPEYLVYQEIYETNKMYMRGVTAIKAAWLPVYVPALCNLSEPLAQPGPRYEPSNGKIYCTVKGTFGPQAWLLPEMEIEFPKTADAYKWFARFLLEGEVFVALKKYRGSLLSMPGVMVKTWARLQPRTEALLRALMSREVCCRKRMEEVWTEDCKYLLPEYLMWLPESAHDEVTLLWPPVE